MPLLNRRRGFTLVELIISVAIVLVLMLGINYVFSTSARTVSTGMALSTIGRDMRNARRVLENDFRAARAVLPSEQPTLLIHNEMVYAWRDKADKLTDGDDDPATFDVDGEPGDEYNMGGTNPATWTAANLPGVYNHRRHRIDRISFYAASPEAEYPRQTGDANSYTQADTSPEAWIQYGPLRLADNGGLYYWKPGARGDATIGKDEQANHNNFFASQFTVGRKVWLLKEPGSLLTGSTYVGTPYMTGHAQVRRTPGGATFARENPPYDTTSAYLAMESRVDVIGASMAQLRTLFAPPGGFSGIPWWNNADGTAGSDRRWYKDNPGASINWMPWAKPFVNKSGFADPAYAKALAHQTREVALTTPIFMHGVSQFIVEFAGDFYDQGDMDTPGVGAGPEPLGTVDYVPLPGGGSQVRWYGMPRDTDGNGLIEAFDVQPLDVAPPASSLGGAFGPRFTGAAEANTGIQKQRTNKALPYIFAWGPTTEGADPVAATTTPPAAAVAGNPYNVRPSLVRITVVLMDEHGRIEDGKGIEYIFKVAQ